MKGLFLDAVDDLALVFRRVARPDDPAVDVNEQRAGGARRAAAAARRLRFRAGRPQRACRPRRCARCAGLRHMIFLGTGARSYMDPEELAELGITVHIIKGYGDTAVAEHAIALMWAAARGIARDGPRHAAGPLDPHRGAAADRQDDRAARLRRHRGRGRADRRRARACGCWPGTARRSAAPGVSFVDLDTLLAESDVLSLHLLLTDETRGFLGAERLALLRPGAILVNTARGALVDEAAMIAALRAGQLRARGARRVRCRAAAGGASADDARERDPVGAQRVPHAGGVGDPAAPGAGHRPDACVTRSGLGPPGGTVDAADLKSAARRAWGFEIPGGHHPHAPPVAVRLNVLACCASQRPSRETADGRARPDV